MHMIGDSFDFGKFNSVENWGIMVTAVDVFLPPKRARKITIPGRSGSYDFGAKDWDNRPLRLSCTLTKHMSKAEFREVVYALSKKDKLRLWDEPEKYYIAELYNPSDVLEYTMEMGREFELVFECEPYAYGASIDTPIKDGRNRINYKGTAETPCLIVLRNTSRHDVVNITLTATKRR